MSESIEFIEFPALEYANPDGLLAMGGNLDASTLVSAYAQGIFPWFNQGQPILWWSPDPRLVLYPSELCVRRSLRKRIRNSGFRVSVNQCFDRVIKACALRGESSDTDSPQNTWISQEMRSAYQRLHHLGYAHSFEVWNQDKLIGGLYGIALGRVFFGESMFSQERDASKVALFFCCQWLKQLEFSVIDCQVSSDHLLSLGATEISRDAFATFLQDIDIQMPTVNIGKGFDQAWQNNVIRRL